MGKCQKTAIMLLLFLFLFSAKVFAAEPEDIREYQSPPYSYTYFKGGNCVWFAWEMAYQQWGIKLPWAGDAKRWVKLDGKKVTRDGTEYELGLSEKPLVNSILILQPQDLRNLYGSFDNDFYGHVAWVTGIEERSGRTYVKVLESSVYPPAEGNRWHGCWWREYEYPLDKFVEAKFLHISQIKTAGLELNSEIDSDGTQRFGILIEGERSVWLIEGKTKKFLGNTQNGKLSIAAERILRSDGKIHLSEPFKRSLSYLTVFFHNHS